MEQRKETEFCQKSEHRYLESTFYYYKNLNLVENRRELELKSRKEKRLKPGYLQERDYEISRKRTITEYDEVYPYVASFIVQSTG